MEELKEKTEKYQQLTETALKEIKVIEGLSEKEQMTAEDFLQMCRNYLNDGIHFREKGDLINALAAFSYAHAWLDAGVRAKLFDAKGNNKLFTLP